VAQTRAAAADTIPNVARGLTVQRCVAAAVREPDLSRRRPEERAYREIKLLVDHRDDVVDQRRRTQQRLRWHLHALPTLMVPLRMLGRSSHLERVSRWLARQEEELQVRLARELVACCRSLNREIAALDQELPERVAETAPALLELPGCAALTAAKLLAEIGPVDRFPKRRAARPPRRRRTAGGELRPRPAPPARPRRQPPAQRCALSHRDHAVALPRRRPCLPRAHESRGQESARSKPLPQTAARPRRLQHTQSEPRLDMGATLAQPTAILSDVRSCPWDRRLRNALRPLAGRTARRLATTPPAVSLGEVVVDLAVFGGFGFIVSVVANRLRCVVVVLLAPRWLVGGSGRGTGDVALA
jgi:hypothetical protein